MKKKYKIIIILVIILFLIWGSFFVTDSIRCKNDKNPIFCISVAMYDDGGSVCYAGLFYNYYRVRKFNSKIDLDETCFENCYLTDYIITPWFFSLSYAKEKAFGD